MVLPTNQVVRTTPKKASDNTVVKCGMAKQRAELILLSLLANIPKRSKECHNRFRSDMGEWTESSDESSTESNGPKPNPPKIKLKLLCGEWHFLSIDQTG